MEKQDIRDLILKKRRLIPSEVLQQCSMKAMKQFIKHPFFQRCHKIAAYWPIEGEVDPRFIIEKAWENHKKCYLPILHPFKRRHLLFAEYQKNDPLIKNRYSILEPKITIRKPTPPWHLDIVLVPVVAFDEAGFRVGRGAGYYDHTFAYLHHPGRISRPKLIGLAYEFQQIEGLPKNPWDVALSGILTEKRFILF